MVRETEVEEEEEEVEGGDLLSASSPSPFLL